MMNDTDSFMSQSEYARRKGVTRQTINRLVKHGKIPLHNGKINLVEADLAIAETRHASYDGCRKMVLPDVPATDQTPQKLQDVIDPPHPKPLGQFTQGLQAVIDGTASLSELKHVEVRKALDFEKYKQLQIENEEKSGCLLDAKNVLDQAFQVQRVARDGVMGLADLIANELAGKTLQLFHGVTEPLRAELDLIVGGERWAEVVHGVITKKSQEVCDGISDALTRQG